VVDRGCGLRAALRGLLNLAGRGDEALHHRADDDVAAWAGLAGLAGLAGRRNGRQASRQ
jgi:hypothetical protein